MMRDTSESVTESNWSSFSTPFTMPLSMSLTGMVLVFLINLVGVSNSMVDRGEQLQHLWKMNCSASVTGVSISSAADGVAAIFSCGDRATFVDPQSDTSVAINVPPKQTGVTSIFTRHTEANDHGIAYNLSTSAVDGAIIAMESNTCFIQGFHAVSSQSSVKPQWTVQAKYCDVATSQIHSKPLVGISDDGKYIVMLLNYNSTLVAASIDTVTGSERCRYMFGATGEETAQSIVIDRNGWSSSIAIGNYVHFINASDCTLFAPPVKMQRPGLATICPMGVFLVFGVDTTAHIYRFNEGKKEYLIDHVTSVPDQSGWYLFDSAISVNKGPLSPNGCVVVLTWLDHSGTNSRITAENLLSKKLYFNYDFPGCSVTDVSTHYDYFASSLSCVNGTGLVVTGDISGDTLIRKTSELPLLFVDVYVNTTAQHNQPRVTISAGGSSKGNNSVDGMALSFQLQ